MPAKILTHINSLRAAIPGGWVPPHLRRPLLEFLASAINARAGNARGGSKASRERSEALRAGIQAAIGLPPPRYSRTFVAIVRNRIMRNPSKYGLRTVPCNRLIREELKKASSQY